jgi:hypothetical protein
LISIGTLLPPTVFATSGFVAGDESSIKREGEGVFFDGAALVSGAAGDDTFGLFFCRRSTLSDSPCSRSRVFTTDSTTFSMDSISRTPRLIFFRDPGKPSWLFAADAILLLVDPVVMLPSGANATLSAVDM